MVNPWMPERSHSAALCGVCTLAVVLILALPQSTSSAENADDWKFDVVHLKKGKAVFEGLLVEEKDDEVRFKSVKRRPGSPTVVISETFKRSEIDQIEKLSSKEREVLAERLEALAKERVELTARLKALDPTGKKTVPLLETVAFKSVAWGKDDKDKALSYDSTYFRLITNASEITANEAALRLEEIYEAYARHLPPRRRSGEKTVILLPQSATDYHLLLKDRGLNLLNPAFYDPNRNQVVCIYEMPRLSEELARVYQKHKQHLDRLKEQEADLNRVYKGKIPLALRNQIAESRKSIEQANQKNERDFETATQRVFLPLYHEAFHAYLSNFVYPPGDGEVPRWLNEGLAQIFETAMIEAGELRVGHADRDRLSKVQAVDMNKKVELVPLADLLKAGSKNFLVVHGSDRQTSDRHYLTSWALAFYLTFDRKLLDGKALDPYLTALQRGADPVSAFEKWTGKSLSDFEKEFRVYLQRLNPNGTLGKAPSEK